MFKLKHTVLFFGLLLIPLIFRLAAGRRFEPFPAVLLPSGASKVPLTHFEARYAELYGQNRNGKWGKINKKELLYPIPGHYHRYIISREFGITKLTPRSGLLRLLLQYGLMERREFKKEDKEQAKAWLKERLQNQGFTEPIIKIIKKRDLLSIESGEILEENEIDEKIIYLD